MSSLIESKETNDSNEVKTTKEDKEPKELPYYVYKPISNSDALQLLKLISANDEQQDVHCRFIEIELPKNLETPGNTVEYQKEEK
jgi:hypothetical protein